MKWISVDVDLPETHERFCDYTGESKGNYSDYVIGRNDVYGWMKCFYDKDRDAWMKEHSSMIVDKITHWFSVDKI